MGVGRGPIPKRIHDQSPRPCDPFPSLPERKDKEMRARTVFSVLAVIVLLAVAAPTSVLVWLYMIVIAPLPKANPEEGQAG